MWSDDSNLLSVSALNIRKCNMENQALFTRRYLWTLLCQMLWQSQMFWDIPHSNIDFLQDVVWGTSLFFWCWYGEGWIGVWGFYWEPGWEKVEGPESWKRRTIVCRWERRIEVDTNAGSPCVKTFWYRLASLCYMKYKGASLWPDLPATSQTKSCSVQTCRMKMWGKWRPLERGFRSQSSLLFSPFCLLKIDFSYIIHHGYFFSLFPSSSSSLPPLPSGCTPFLSLTSEQTGFYGRIIK